MVTFLKMVSGCPKARTGVLAEALADAGYRSVRQACLACGARTTEVGELLAGKIPVYGPSGRANASALALAECLGETPERLFGQPAPEVPTARLSPKPDADAVVLVRAILRTLTDLERAVLTAVYRDGKTVTAIAAGLYEPVHRVQAVKDRALRKLRNPARAKVLAVAAESFGGVNFRDYYRAVEDARRVAAAERERYNLLHPNG